MIDLLSILNDIHSGLNANPDTFKIRLRYNNSKELLLNLTDVQKLELDIPDKETHEFVDLGLSVKWATCNVGASNPEDYGGHFAWGETKEKDKYDWSTYKYSKGYHDKLTKYCNNNTLGYYGITDHIYTLDAADDAAHSNWSGIWRMPTISEWAELLDSHNCDWTWTKLKGTEGYLVKSKKYGYSDRFIFLPAVGNDFLDVQLLSIRFGIYSSSSLDTSNPIYAHSLYFNARADRRIQDTVRTSGLSVRPVCP